MMEELLTNLKREFDLSLGNKTFSPIMQLSIGLAMKYHQEVKNGFDKPFHLNFPDKLDAALWLSLALMRNYLKDDFKNQPPNRIETLNLKKGNKIEIYGAIARVEYAFRDQVKISFLDQSGIFVNDSDYDHVNLVELDRRENRFDIYRRNKANIKKNRNAISKLLVPNKSTIVNPKILKSKILVIAGRGNTGSFTNRTKQEKIFNENLFDVFKGGKNLIIKPDLEEYKFFGIREDSKTEEIFEHYFLKFINELKEELPDQNNEIEYLVDCVKSKAYRTIDFKSTFENIVTECDEESKYHEIKDKYYPGIKEKLPDHLKSVVINDVTHLEDYRGVIKELLKKGIPVLAISNKYIEDKNELKFFDNYFHTHPEDLRFSWDKNKIRKLSKPSLYIGSFLDHELWNKCLKFSNQKIEIETTEPHPFDKLILNVQRSISKIEGQEKLKNAYWRYFNPLVYSFKNSISWVSYHDELLEKFLSVYHDIKRTLTQETRSIFEISIQELKNSTKSNKTFETDNKVFSQSIVLEDRTVLFPEGNFKNLTIDNLDSTISEITFPGFPLNEPINNHLLDSISEYIITKIKIICWPKEGELTYRYIFNRLRAGYYSDNVPRTWDLPVNLLLKNNDDIQDEINRLLSYDMTEITQNDTNKFQDEEVLDKISSFKYSPYEPNLTSEESYIVKCNIIDFVGNKFMFLPKNSSVLAKIETGESNFIFRRASFKDLSPGDELFQYDLPRHELREISKKIDGSDLIFNELEIWKDSLKKTYEKHNNNVNSVVEKLDKLNQKMSIGGSPTYQNLRNWLFDDDMHAPSEKNLKMILAVDPDKSKIKKVPDIIKAAKAAKSLSQRISGKIKKAITTILNKESQTDSDEIFIEILDSVIKVKFSKIVQLQEAEIEIEYQNTRKIVE